MEEGELVTNTILMMLGIQSCLFAWDDDEETFILQRVKIKGHESRSLMTLLNALIDLANIFQRLQLFATRMVRSQGSEEGDEEQLVWQALGRGLLNLVRQWRTNLLTFEQSPSLTVHTGAMLAVKGGSYFLVEEEEETVPSSLANSSQIFNHPIFYSPLPCLRVNCPSGSGQAIKETNESKPQKRMYAINEELRLSILNIFVWNMKEQAILIYEVIPSITNQPNATGTSTFLCS